MRRVFTATPPVGGRTGKLKKDKNGYYDFIVGALGTQNTSGIHYSLEGSVDAFSSNSSLQRKISKGALYGERNHPQKASRTTIGDYIRRLLRIEPKNVSVHYNSIALDDEVYKLDNNPLKKGEVGIVAKLKPAGPFGPSLESSLENPLENVSFSIRSLTNTYDKGPITIKDITTAITFDDVIIGGMETASKYAAPGLEEDISGISDTLIAEIEKDIAGDDTIALEDRDMLTDIIGEIKKGKESLNDTLQIYQDIPLVFKDL